ncbi:MAG TPA: FAD/NAD(P)-binding oxidoreductase [Thermomicrobiaceae bacterium]|nr:FAD/NAD(P)-binding oxidoreductase [Thermomicrobiaceae bacterium]
MGGGMTAAAAVAGIRDLDPDGSIGIVGSESEPSYKRPPLSKGLWKGEPEDAVWLKLDSYNVTLHLGREVNELDRQAKQIVDDQGTVYGYDRLLLATGSTPRRLSAAVDERVVYYRTIADYHRLRALTEQGQRFAVIGGGFIGSEIAAALAMNGKDVSVIFPDAGIGSRVFPAELSQFLNGYYRARGVQVMAGETVSGLEAGREQVIVRTSGGNGTDGREMVFDGVVVGIGVRPNVALAEAAGLEVDNGVVVDALLRSSDPAIFAAGDVASFFNRSLNSRLRVEHEDNANVMGRRAGQNMAGATEPYDYLPFFYSDLFDLGYEAVGELDARLETVVDWKEPNREGVIHYLRDGRVRGVLLWNVWDQVEAARQLIADSSSFQPDELQGRLLVAH